MHMYPEYVIERGQHLNAILGLLDERTRERNSRGVLGTVNV